MSGNESAAESGGEGIPPSNELEEEEYEVEEESDEDWHNSKLVQAILTALDVSRDKSLFGGEFAVHGEVPSDLSGIAHSGVFVGSQPLSLPILGSQCVDKLVEEGMVIRAPFGRGEATVTDLDVRRTWQVAPASVSFKNDKFMRDVKVLAKRAADMMGVSSGIIVNFHKLLIYGEGDFFKPHRDSVHTSRQFATLIIQLPSVYEGGQFEVSTASQHMTIDQSGDASAFKLYYTMFFADCLHEVKPLTNGVRVCLTFDICHFERNGRVTALPEANYSEHLAKRVNVVSMLKDALAEWSVFHSKVHETKDDVCDCGQKLISPALECDDDYDEIEPFRALNASETCFLVIPLDHLLPRNDLQLLFKSGISEESLWAFRGADRATVRCLLDARNALLKENIDVQLDACSLKFEYAHGGYISRMDWTLGEDVRLCQCMVQCLSERNTHKIYFVSYDTGNEGSATEFQYESTGIAIYAKHAALKAFTALARLSDSTIGKLLSKKDFFDDEERLISLVATRCKSYLSSFAHKMEHREGSTTLRTFQEVFGFDSLVTPGTRALIGRHHQPDSDCWCLRGLDDAAGVRLNILKAAVAKHQWDTSSVDELASFFQLPGEFIRMVMGCLGCQFIFGKEHTALAYSIAIKLVPFESEFRELVEPLIDASFLSSASGSVPLLSIRAGFVSLAIQRQIERVDASYEWIGSLSEPIPTLASELIESHKSKGDISVMLRFLDGVQTTSVSQGGEKAWLFAHCLTAAWRIMQLMAEPGSPNFALALRCAQVLSLLPDQALLQFLALSLGEDFLDPRLEVKLKPSGSMVMRSLAEQYAIRATRELDRQLERNLLDKDLETYQKYSGKTFPIVGRFLESGAEVITFDYKGYFSDAYLSSFHIKVERKLPGMVKLTRDLAKSREYVIERQKPAREIIRRLREEIDWQE